MNKSSSPLIRGEKERRSVLRSALPLLLCLQEPIHGEITGQM